MKNTALVSLSFIVFAAILLSACGDSEPKDKSAQLAELKERKSKLEAQIAQLEKEVGAQAGAEYFLRTGGPRLPVRALLGLRGRLASVGLGLVLRGGQDFEPGLSPTWRGEALLTLCWHAPDAR